MLPHTFFALRFQSREGVVRGMPTRTTYVDQYCKIHVDLIKSSRSSGSSHTSLLNNELTNSNHFLLMEMVFRLHCYEDRLWAASNPLTIRKIPLSEHRPRCVTNTLQPEEFACECCRRTMLICPFDPYTTLPVMTKNVVTLEALSLPYLLFTP